MELHKAIKEIVTSKGADMICNTQIINYLLDYQAFKEKPATKLILRAIIDSGYAENILALISTTGWETKYRQYQHEFIDSCGYKEELAVYVFESIAYGLGLNAGNEEPEIKPAFKVDSFFDIPEETQTQQSSAPQPQQKPSVDPSDLYTIALSFFNEGKYVQARGFMIKALGQYPNTNIPALYLKLLGDISMKMDFYQEALKYYNESFTRKATEMKVSVADLRESLKRHKVKDFENSMFCYFFCMYYENQINNAQWRQFVKGEARYGLMEAIQYCANNGINPIECHFDIYFSDRNLIKTGDYLYNDGSFSHEYSKSKEAIGVIIIMTNSDYEKSQGWTHGYIISLHAARLYYNGKISDSFAWSKMNDDLPFPHSHYTIDDIKHWSEIQKIESEDYISINDINNYPAFFAALNYRYNMPISGTSGWKLPSIHFIRKISTSPRYYLFPKVAGLHYWTSSQADGGNAISFCPTFLSIWNQCVRCEPKMSNLAVLPIAAF